MWFSRSLVASTEGEEQYLLDVESCGDVTWSIFSAFSLLTSLLHFSVILFQLLWWKWPRTFTLLVLQLVVCLWPAVSPPHFSVLFHHFSRLSGPSPPTPHQRTVSVTRKSRDILSIASDRPVHKIFPESPWTTGFWKFCSSPRHSTFTWISSTKSPLLSLLIYELITFK